MRKQIKKVINRLGYTLIRQDLYNKQLSKSFLLDSKYNSLIQEVINLNQEFIFSEFPEGSGNRIKLMSRLLGTQISEAIYIIHFLNKSLDRNGDICEFGVAQGATSALIADEISSTTKNLWLFDSFEGLPKPTDKDLLKDDIFKLGTIGAYEGQMSCSEKMVKEKLSEIAFPINRIKIVPGFIEETIKLSNFPDQISFAYVDFDFYEPTKIVLELLDTRLSIGGFAVIDDYDFFSSGVKSAVDEFINARKDKFRFSMPCKSAGHFCILERIS